MVWKLKKSLMRPIFDAVCFQALVDSRFVVDKYYVFCCLETLDILLVVIQFGFVYDTYNFMQTMVLFDSCS